MGSGIKSPGVIIGAMFVANVGGMTAMVSFPTLVSMFQSAWELNNAQAGWVSGVYFAGYMITVPVLTGLTDRLDPKKIIIASMIGGIISAAAFAHLATGFWSATLWRFVQGVSFAGIYMPLMKALSDTLPESSRSRGAAFISASYATGVSFSYFSTGQLEGIFGWQTAFLMLGLGPLLGVGLTILFLPSNPMSPQREGTFSLDYRAVFSNKRALAYMIAYGVHNGEASIMRAWVVAYFVFAQAGAGALIVNWSPATIATVVTMVGVPLIVVMSELVPKVGRRRLICLSMTASGTLGIVLALSLWGPYWLTFAVVFIYAAALSADSGIINGGIISRSDPAIRGQSMAMHAVFGSGAAFLLPVLFGFVLDIAGGEQSRAAWTWAFGATAVFIAIGPIALITLDREDKG
ncbi:MAG: MFS transporter [Rhodospirillaceae bacterium]|jgi:MFS family permease|nr:MFS transporter [Rhodospirillales bacterium]MBT3906505.1 MFS transporter [Rhodospirillaceae bacterium]MBT4701533.1 MFS transporter [Rhodospirillaceae bacterium]MBT5034066.1 MFS transporter [Rhodospirillaceae bacterium]MBT6218852.1 MFS transporter [Rhodospirillaceae bacterium]